MITYLVTLALFSTPPNCVNAMRDKGILLGDLPEAIGATKVDYEVSGPKQLSYDASPTALSATQCAAAAEYARTVVVDRAFVEQKMLRMQRLMSTNPKVEFDDVGKRRFETISNAATAGKWPDVNAEINILIHLILAPHPAPVPTK